MQPLVAPLARFKRGPIRLCESVESWCGWHRKKRRRDGDGDDENPQLDQRSA
jgi:hypothetical protein